MTDLSVGSTIAGCRLEAVAGRGGMGVVYRATELALDRPVAVKAMAPQLAEDEAYRQRFQRESHIAASIDHPNVIPVYGAGELEGTLYLIMRWVDGTDLRAVLAARGRLAPNRAVNLLRPVASALAAAHKRGLVHRDIKPANVLISNADQEDEEHVYLTDFGIARRTDGQSAMTRTGVLVGTIDYTAPERIEGGKGDAASDIYAFGCMLFEALTGRVPFDRPTDLAKMHAHLNAPTPSVGDFVDDVPASLDEVATKALARRPEDRFASAAELAGALGRVAEEIAGPARVARSEMPTAEADLGTELAATVHVREPVEPITAALPPEGSSTAVDDRPPTPPAAPVGRRRRALWVAPLVLLVLAGVAVAVIAGASGGSGAHSTAAANSPPVPANVVSSHSPGLSRGLAVALGGSPGGLSASPTGELWASVPAAGVIVRISSDGVVKRIAVAGRPGAIAAGPAGVWLGGSTPGAVALLDPANGRQLAAARLGADPAAITVNGDDGSAWTSDATGAIRHVNAHGSVVDKALLTPAPTAIRWGEGWLWATNGSDLVRVGSGATTTFEPGSAPVSVALDDGVWTAHANGHVKRFNPQPAKLAVNSDVPVATSLDAIGASEHTPFVWAISQRAKRLYRISSAGMPMVIGTATFASPPVALAVVSGKAWVATEDGSLVEISY